MTDWHESDLEVGDSGKELEYTFTRSGKELGRVCDWFWNGSSLERDRSDRSVTDI